MGMKCTFNIVLFLKKMKYEYHDLLVYTECTMDPFEGEKGNIET